MTTISKTPSNISIKPYRMDFEFSDAIPRYWAYNDPFMTHFVGALSTFFPDGERFFIDSVRHFRDKVTDNKVRQQEIAGFIGQEAHHSKEHESLNLFMEKRGLPALSGAKAALTLLNWGRRKFPPRTRLAATVALEHFTAILANRLLSHPDFMNHIDDSIKPLWMWHAIEETEHKAVAFDLYKDIKGNNHKELVTTMIMATALLAATTALYQVRFMAKDGQLLNIKSWAFGLNKLFGRQGLISGLIPDYLDFFKEDFHPWDHANSELVQYWRTRLDVEMDKLKLLKAA
jgi:predicted metal-dependent hydrolase